MIPEEIISQLVDEAIEIESQTKKNEEGRYIVNVLTFNFNFSPKWDVCMGQYVVFGRYTLDEIFAHATEKKLYSDKSIL